jgi:hypothetical protein
MSLGPYANISFPTGIIWDFSSFDYHSGPFGWIWFRGGVGEGEIFGSFPSALHENMSCFELTPAHYSPQEGMGVSDAGVGSVFTGPCCWHGKVQKWRVVRDEPGRTELVFLAEGNCPHPAPHGNHTWSSVVINRPPDIEDHHDDDDDDIPTVDYTLPDLSHITGVGEGLIFGSYPASAPPWTLDLSHITGVGEGLIFGSYPAYTPPPLDDYLGPDFSHITGVGEGEIFGSYPAYVPPSPVDIPDIPPVGGIPELHFVGGNILGVQGIVIVNDNGTVDEIKITDPGATVIRQGHRDDEDDNAHDSGEQAHHHQDPTFRDHLYHHHQRGHNDNRGVRPPRVIIEAPEGTDWFQGFQATAKASTDPDEIAAALPDFIKTRDEILAATCSGFNDPLAQTFLIQKNRYMSSHGLFVESIDLCFQSKPSWTSTGNPVTVELRPTVNGYPSSRTIMDGYGGAKASVTKNSDEINVADADPTQNLRPWENPVMHTPSRYSGIIPGFGGLGMVNGHASADNGYRNDPNLPAPRYTKFKFTTPIYLEPDKQYAIVVRSNDPTYKVWISDARASTPINTPTGSDVVATNDSDWALNSDTVASNNGKQYGGSLFVSQNGMTWTAEQNLDLMFRVNVCDFKHNNNTKVWSSAGLGLDADFEYDRMEIDQFSTIMPRGTNILQKIRTVRPDELGLTSAAWDVSTVSAGLVGAEDVINKTYNFDDRRILRAGRTSENGKMGDVMVETNLRSDHRYTSPVLDFSNMNGKFIRNRINAVITLAGEEASSGGNAQARYITRPVNLAEGMDASDIKVFLTANKPESGTIRVYYKVLSAYDSQNLSDKRWTAMIQISPDENYYNTSENFQISDSKIEYEYISGVDRNIIYENGNESYDTFKSFAIKIVMYSSNPARVPTISNLRAIAVT